MTTTQPAYELVGHEGIFMLPGGRATYSDVMIKDGKRWQGGIRLARLEPTKDGLHQVNRYIAWEQPIVVVKDFTAEHEAERVAELEGWECL